MEEAGREEENQGSTEDFDSLLHLELFWTFKQQNELIY